MQWQSFPNFNLGGSAQIQQGPYVACGIAAGSEVDTCLVGDQKLGPMSLVPCRGGTNLTALRGYRTYGGQPIQNQLETPGGAPGGQVGGTLVLQLYEACDVLVPPGPRAPLLVSGFVASTALPATNATAALLLRIPFHGRRQGTFSVKRAGNIELNVLVQGVRYLDPGLRASLGKDASLAHFSRERTGLTWFSTGPVEVRFGGGDGFQALFVDWSTTAPGGGVDPAIDMHGYDELDVYVYGVSDANSNIYGAGEAWGERV